LEAFVQDNWRVSRRLTLDLGLRFIHQYPTVNYSLNTTDFLLSAYNPAAAERIYLPDCLVSTASKACPTASQKALDPVTGTTTFFALAGTFVPASVGGYSTTPNPFDGMVRADGSNPALPMTLWTQRSLLVDPRIGFAYDLFGNGKTAIRGGFGIFTNQISTQLPQNSSGNPPDTYNRAVYYTTIDQIPNFVNNAGITPLAPTETVGTQRVQGAYNGSFMIQQQVGFGTVLEAAWVFNLGRHLPATYQLNPEAPYSEYNPANFNPNVAYLPANTSGKNLADNYFRPIAGVGAITAVNFANSSTYQSLQVTGRRNMTRHLSYGAAYTFMKTMAGTPDPYFAEKFRNYGPSYSPARHVIAVNYVYEAPNLGQKLNFKPMGWVTDHWTWSGITQWRSDIRTSVPGISFNGTSSTNPQMDWTGGYDSARMIVDGNLSLPAGQASFVGGTAVPTSQGSPAINGYGPNGTPGNQILNESALVIPYPCSWTAGATPQKGIGQNMSECLGNAGTGSLVPLPFTNVENFDMTFSKNFPLKSERRVVIFRAEMYNIFNHPQFSGGNITPGYDWNNWKNGVLVQTSNTLGRYSGTLNPRQMSMSLRFQF
jgi:hypothetical protein